jgi:hypothetical protein
LVSLLFKAAAWNETWNEVRARVYHHGMGKRRTGHVERLPSGAYRAVVYAGTDPLTRRQQRLKSASFRTEGQARIELGKLLGQAAVLSR